MRRVLVKAILALAAIASPQLAARVEACSCFALPTPYKSFADARAVFTGRVTGSTDVPFEQKVRDETYTYNARHFRIAVEESLKGVKSEEVVVSAGSTNSSCYSGFTVGESYLVYAFGGPGDMLYTHMCSRTNNLDGAQDEIFYLRAMLKGEPEPRVYGSVTRVDNDLSRVESSRVTPMAGVRVAVEGDGRRYEAVTDEHGRYRLAGVPDGTYKARPLPPEKYTVHFPAEEEFTLGDGVGENYGRNQYGRTAYASFRVGWNNEVGGRVLDSEGTPVRRASASLFALRGADEEPLLVEKSHYNLAEGKYRFSGLTPGKYLPSVTVEVPFKGERKTVTAYYPGVSERSLAVGIEVGESGTLSDSDVRLPRPYVVREVAGVVVWPDGSPVAKARVALAGKENPSEKDASFDWLHADEQGRFSVQGFVGAEYWVLASVGTYGMRNASGKELWDTGVRDLKARPLKVTVRAADNRPLRIVIPVPEGVDVTGEP